MHWLVLVRGDMMKMPSVIDKKLLSSSESESNANNDYTNAFLFTVDCFGPVRCLHESLRAELSL